MVTPTRDQIREKALSLYMDRQFKAGLPALMVTDEELKEENVWVEAKLDLMYGAKAKAVDEELEALRYEADQLEEVVVASKTLKDLLSAAKRLDSIKAKIKDLRSERKKEQARAEERVKELEAEIERLRKEKPPPPVLTGEEIGRLADFFLEKLDKAGVDATGLEPEFKKALDVSKSYDENLKLIEEFADRIIAEKAPPPPEELPRIHATSVDIGKYKAGEYYIMLLNPEKYGDRPIMAITLRNIKEVEEYVARGEEEYLPIALGMYPAPGEEWWEELAEELKHDAIIYWTAEDIVWAEEVKADRIIWHKKYTREDLEPLKVDELRRILAVKGLSTAGKKAELIDRILGIKPPKPPVEKPPEVPPPKPPVVVPPPVEVGLTKADETYLHDIFLAKLMEAGYSHSKARGHLPEFRVELRTIREDVKGVARDEAVRRARDFVEGLVDRILVRKPPVAPPVVRPPEVVPPVAVPVVIAPPVRPPPGVIRKYGMPWAWHLCPACVGEGKPEEACRILRSPYLENRLRRLALPTSDPLFYKLCEDHKRKYGGAFEYFPRDTVEFWVGEAVMKGDIDIGVLVGMGISESYVHHCVRVYEENKHLAVQ